MRGSGLVSTGLSLHWHANQGEDMTCAQHGIDMQILHVCSFSMQAHALKSAEGNHVMVYTHVRWPAGGAMVICSS